LASVDSIIKCNTILIFIEEWLHGQTIQSFEQC
jgi:hypothetical protein